MKVETGIPYSQRKAYRLIGVDLFSAMTSVPIQEQVYSMEKANVIDAEDVDRSWRVVVQAGKVCLEHDPG